MTQSITPIKRILIVSPQPFYEDRGTPIAIKHVLNALLELGYSVDILTYPIGKDIKHEQVRYFRSPNPFGFSEIRVGFSFKKLVLDVCLFFELKKRLSEDHYVCIHAVEEAAFLALWTAKKYKTPVIYDMQSSMAEQMCGMKGLGNPLMRKLFYACENWLIKNAQKTVCSAGLSTSVLNALPSANIQEWNYPGVVETVSDHTLQAVKEELYLQEKDRVILYTGNFAEYQGIDLLVGAIPEVVEQVPQTVLVLVGQEDLGKDPLIERLKKTLPKYAYRIVKRQPKERMAAFMALADVVVSPRSFGNNLPLKVLEYLASGCVIVATDIHAHRTVLNADLALLVPPNSKGIAEGLVRILEDKSLYLKLSQAVSRYAENKLSWLFFVRTVNDLYFQCAALEKTEFVTPVEKVSIIIPVRNAQNSIKALIEQVQKQTVNSVAMEIIVVDDGSTDNTQKIAQESGATVLMRGQAVGNPAAARNLGAQAATGDVLVFLDADCTPCEGWLEALLRGYEQGEVCVGGALAMPEGLSLTARVDYYNGWYHVHEKMPRTHVTQHPPCNLSVLRSVFNETSGFNETTTIAYSHEELQWQSELIQKGERILFDPQAWVYHHNRPGFIQLLKRNYRWASSAIESKSRLKITRWPWLYRYPCIPIFLSIPLIPIQVIYITVCWMRAGKWEPLVLVFWSLAARTAYGVGMCLGGIQWWLFGAKVTSTVKSEGCHE